MAGYGNFNFNKKKKGNKIGIAVLCVAVLIAAAVFYIGVTAGSNGEEMERISSAVAENTALKERISELEEKIASLEQQIADKEAELSERPTARPALEDTQNTPPPASKPLSPREGLR